MKQGLQILSTLTDGVAAIARSFQGDDDIYLIICLT